MPRADELEPYDRIRHPDTGEIVEVLRVMPMLSKTRINFKVRGEIGSFEVAGHKELEDCS